MGVHGSDRSPNYVLLSVGKVSKLPIPFPIDFTGLSLSAARQVLVVWQVGNLCVPTASRWSIKPTQTIFLVSITVSIFKAVVIVCWCQTCWDTDRLIQFSEMKVNFLDRSNVCPNSANIYYYIKSEFEFWIKICIWKYLGFISRNLLFST